MRHIKVCFSLLLCSIAMATCHAASTDPWFTGPLLALSAQTVPIGHSQLELYGYNITGNSVYNNRSIAVDSIAFTSTQFMPTFIYGLAQNVDVEVDLLYQYNRTPDKSAEGLGDTSIILGFQLLKQEQRTRPDLKLSIMEIFPSGRFDNLPKANHGVDAMGMGSFQTAIGLNAQHLSQFSDQIYLNMHASVIYLYASNVHINGLNSYGGGMDTNGEINPGNVLALDLAAELSLNQNWVAVLEGYCEYETASKFHGYLNEMNSVFKKSAINSLHRLFPSKHNINKLSIGNDDRNIFTLAPAVEYNFSATYGIIMGTWFTLSGKSTPKFFAPVIAVNANW